MSVVFYNVRLRPNNMLRTSSTPPPHPPHFLHSLSLIGLVKTFILALALVCLTILSSCVALCFPNPFGLLLISLLISFPFPTSPPPWGLFSGEPEADELLEQRPPMSFLRSATGTIAGLWGGLEDVIGWNILVLVKIRGFSFPFCVGNSVEKKSWGEKVREA